MLKKSLNRILEFSFSLSLELLKLFKFGFYIVGSKAAFFSLSQAISPISGLFGGTTSSALIFCIRTIITMTISSFGLVTSLLYHIPTFCGALYFSTSSKLLKIAIPATCIILFITHKTGSQAFIYSFYWFIPIFLVVLNKKSIFLQAIGSTFTVHAVGSVIWLHTHNISAQTWNSLIPVVWAERLSFALTITTLYYTIEYLKVIITNKEKISSTNYQNPIPNIK